MDEAILARVEFAHKGCEPPHCYALQVVAEVRRLQDRVVELKQILAGYDVTLEFALSTCEESGIEMPKTREAQENLQRESVRV